MFPEMRVMDELRGHGMESCRKESVQEKEHHGHISITMGLRQLAA
jgi:predicted nucleic acid-binding protein